jgi:hypothetical protein
VDSESQLINRCFSTWRKLAHTSTLESRLSSSDEYGSINLTLTRDDSSIEKSSPKLCSRHTATVQSAPIGQCTDDRLGYLRDLSNRIQDCLHLSSHSSKDTTTPSVKRTKSVVRRLFVENEPLPSSGPSDVCDSSSQSISVQLCSCLNPQVAREVHEFQKRIADFPSSVDRKVYESTSRCDTHKGEIGNTDDNTHPSNSRSIAAHCFARNVQHNDFIKHTTLNTLSISTVSSCCLNRAFHCWLALTKKKLSLQQRSAYLAKLLKLRRLKRNFEQWREIYAKTTTLRSLEMDYHDQTCMLTTRSYFCLWQEKATRGVHQAEAYDRKRCLRNALTQWKIHFQQTKEENAKVRTYMCIVYILATHN